MNPWLERIPDLNGGKYPGMDPGEAVRLFDELLAGGKDAIIGVIDTLRGVDDGSDWKSRLLLHALATHTGHPERVAQRKTLERIYAAELQSRRPPAVRIFLARQLRGFAGTRSIPALAALLQENDPQLIDAAAAALTVIGEPAEAALKKVRSETEGHAREAVDHALAQIG